MFKVLVLEDESYTLRFLEKLISEHPKVELVLGTSSSQDAVRLAGEMAPDLAFLDIELAPEDHLNGIDVARAINTVSPRTEFIFVTGYAKYAVDSFAVHPYDYLLKPIKRDKLMQAISGLDADRQDMNLQKGPNNRLVIKSQDSIIFINIDDIFFIEKQGKKAFIHSVGGINESNCIFNELESLLGSQFLRVHKSYVVNMDKVSQIKDAGNQSYAIHFEGYNGVAIMSRNRFRVHIDRFTPSF
ncbi:MAG: LytR/AlgR family response regulator transcription factor [Syntrophomonadaceae bacterium]|jgi:two-component system LytT family response regulator